MRIALFLLLMLSASSYSVTGYSLPYNFAAGDTVKASRIMSNYTAGSTWSTANADSIETKFVRFSDTKDTTFDTLKAYRIRATNNLRASGTLTADGLASVDSLHSTKGISGTNAWLTGIIFTDSIFANSGIDAATANFTEVNSSGHVYGSTGGFSSTMTVDSLKSVKGISASQGIFSGLVSGVGGTFTATISADSLKTTKGIYSAGKVGIGKTAPAYMIEAQDSTTGIVYLSVKNTQNGASSSAAMRIASATNTAVIRSYPSTFTTAGSDVANGMSMYTGGAGGITVNASNPAGTITLYTADTARIRLTADGAIVPVAISATPANPPASAAQFYVKGGKFVIQYMDGAQIRFKYLDLSGTGVTWVHSTSAP